MMPQNKEIIICLYRLLFCIIICDKGVVLNVVILRLSANDRRCARGRKGTLYFYVGGAFQFWHIDRMTNGTATGDFEVLAGSNWQ